MKFTIDNSITIQIIPCAYGAFLSIKLLRQPKANEHTKKEKRKATDWEISKILLS